MKYQDDSIVLSIILMTYNHEPFISKALDSVLMQRANFNFEIIIAEDFSTDNTRSIIRAYEDKYPGKFHVIFRNKNIGAEQNFIEAEPLSKGKYIQFLTATIFGGIQKSYRSRWISWKIILITPFAITMEI